MIDASERIARPGTSTGGQIRTARPVTLRPAATSNLNPASSTAANSSTGSPASTVLQTVFQTVPLASAVAGATSTTSGGGIGGTLESIASTVLKSGLGMVPLIGGLLGLFGGGDSPATPTLSKYAMPPSIAFESADIGSGIGDADYDQMGLPRVSGASYAAQSGFGWPPRLGAQTPFAGTGSGASAASTGGPGGSSGANVSPPQITVNVQAMDARSFLDRSSDIAAAVRDAMLNLNSINDVVSEL